LSFLRLMAGLTGRAEKPPPQLGHTFCKTSFTQSSQKVHSNVQIMASVESGGKALLQCSHEGRSSSIQTSL
jgi:hypothetical protein